VHNSGITLPYYQHIRYDQPSCQELVDASAFGGAIARGIIQDEDRLAS
jgi:hypothetical protein